MKNTEVDQSKLTFGGSLNYILQVWNDEDKDDPTVTVDIYMPRKNRVVQDTLPKEEVRAGIEETIERMKIAITQFEEYLDGKRDKVYYWELEKEPWMKEIK